MWLWIWYSNPAHAGDITQLTHQGATLLWSNLHPKYWYAKQQNSLAVQSVIIIQLLHSLWFNQKKKKHTHIYIYLYIHEHTHVAQFKILKVATDKLMIWLIVFILLCCSVCATGQVDDHLFILLLITGLHVTSELLLRWVLVFQNNG